MPESSPANRLTVVPLSSLTIKRSLFGDPNNWPCRFEQGFMATIKTMIGADLEAGVTYSSAELYEQHKQWCIRSRRNPIGKTIFGRNLARLGCIPSRDARRNYWTMPDFTR